jgi:hypothetical protein
VHVNVSRLLPIFIAVPLACACSLSAQSPIMDSKSVLTSPHPWPTPRIARPSAPPQILALWMNETTIPSGSNWYGRAITSTNVASLEIRTESFSFVAERTAYGDFRFSQHVLDMVPFYKRPYIVEVIARNAAGDRAERLVRVKFQ